MGSWLAPLEMSEFSRADGRHGAMVKIRVILGVTVLLGFFALFDQRHYADEIAVWAVSPYWRWGIRLGAVSLGFLGLVALSTWSRLGLRWLRLLDGIQAFTIRLGHLRFFFVAILALTFPCLILGEYGRFFLPFFTRLWVFWVLVSIASWFTSSLMPGNKPLLLLVSIAIGFAAVYRLAVFLADLSSYPFTLSWSEASRYYYASLFLSKKIYGVSIPPSILHPTRYLMQALAFLIPGAGLPTHRAWQVIIWVTSAVLTGVVLAKRAGVDGKLERWLFCLWVFLFLFQGPVYYHLLVMVILTLWVTRSSNGLRTLLVVVLLSTWAGMSRVNWVPVPGMLAALLYLLEQAKGTKSYYNYLRWPVLWFVSGTVIGLGSQSLYLYLSGNDPSTFGSSFSSQLLWYRLLPSATYPLGVLPAILCASLPLCIIWIARRNAVLRRTSWIRLLGIVAILVVLFIGGILVSVKIGGGSNLHNMDAFLVAMLISATYLLGNKWVPPAAPMQTTAWQTAGLMAAIWMPICFALGSGLPLRSHDLINARLALDSIQSTVDQVTAKGEEILFISQRHLLTFGEVEGVELVPEYETVFLMEMAMSRTQPYMDQFHADLANQRFGLIVVDQLSTQLQGREHDFAEENNAWVEEVSIPILCYYDELTRLTKPSLQFLVPSVHEVRCTL